MFIETTTLSPTTPPRYFVIINIGIKIDYIWNQLHKASQ